MCGILAVVSFRNPDGLLAHLPQMAKMMRHRGPDDEGYAFFSLDTEPPRLYGGVDTPAAVYRSQLPFQPQGPFKGELGSARIGLAHRRLSIIDLSPSGHQPQCDPARRYWIAFNGEIYNYREIRTELEGEGVAFSGDSDTEVALLAYIFWGERCEERFNGMWAIVIWDDRDKKLWISRDRFGVKPLFYTFLDDALVVASEAKTIQPVVPLYPNHGEMLACLMDGPSEAHRETLFDGVYRFPPGHHALYDVRAGARELQPHRYWELPPTELGMAFSGRRLEEYAEHYRELLKDSVRLRLRADTKLSCALSGGLDSSSITYFANELIGAEGDLYTVSNIYRDPQASHCDESGFIDRVAGRLGVTSLRREPDPTQLLQKGEWGLWVYENVFNDIQLSALTVFELCKDEGIKVNLDGQGADEILAGYSRFWRGYFMHQSRLAPDYWNSLLKAPLDWRSRLRGLAKNYKPLRAPVSVMSRIADRVDQRTRLLRQTGLDELDIEPVNLALHSSVRKNLQNLLRNIDYLSMANSVESRQPFMDYRLIEFLNGVPATYKLRHGWTKYLARHAMVGRLPDEVVWRKDKMGWPQPSRQWLQSRIQTEVEEEIRSSGFLADLIGGWREGELECLQGSTRLYLRFFNMARMHRLFFEQAA